MRFIEAIEMVETVAFLKTLNGMQDKNFDFFGDIEKRRKEERRARKKRRAIY